MNIFVSVFYNVLLLLYYAHKSINAMVSKVKKSSVSFENHLK